MRKPGFTVVEVVIVTLFITFCYYTGTWGYGWYTRSSRASAAETFVKSLADAQKAYFAKTGRYLPLHSSKQEAFPKEIAAEGAVIEALPKEFATLGTVQMPESPFFFRVAVLAGSTEVPPSDLINESKLNLENVSRGEKPWFYIVAFADQDGDGEFSKIEMASWDENGVVSTARTE